MKHHTLLKLFDKSTDAHKKKLKPGTKKNCGTTRQYVASFIQKTFGEPDINVRKLNFKFATEFELFIPAHPIKKHDPCIGNGIAKNLERLSGIANWGSDLGWVKPYPFGRLQAHKTPSHPNRLKPHHILLMEGKRLNNPKLALVRDLFLFSCYTGFAFVEVMRMAMKHFERSNTGKFCCSLYRLESSTLEALPLLPEAVALIKKYKDLPVCVASGFIFPRITNQEVNRCLKILQEIYDIPFDLTFHAARHTFGFIAVKAGIDVKIVKKFMGHLKITTTDKYTEVDEEMLKEALAKAEAAKRKSANLPSPKEYLDKPGPKRKNMADAMID
ncbi:MAG: phage integrase SAM-like domain-containing protein [Candidatus Pseudobacter hemicellulosilyticus]|uniref:Phage integrase SAM-like domain-containing protein n=1 Tax=Candidatus Pseudobacter hemicellulosilyticus TaxID=3121375 RepID=A0AAJ6BIZ6_9BACT|nr:MAG: phage integrase SAM-like domain-containing protein [Pseudobacter sp.]